MGDFEMAAEFAGRRASQSTVGTLRGVNGSDMSL